MSDTMAARIDVVRAFEVMPLRPLDAWMRDDPAAQAEIHRKILGGPCIALPDNESPVAICGMTDAYGVGTVWMVAGDGFASGGWRLCVRRQREFCRLMVAVRGLRRLQALVDANEQQHIRYAWMLGFYQESVTPHRGMGPRGEDLLIFNWRKGN